MTDIGIVSRLDQVHVYVDTGYFSTTLCTATEIISTEMISCLAKFIQPQAGIIMNSQDA